MNHSIPQEFAHLLDDPESLTYKAAKHFNAKGEDFLNWRWQMSHQIRDLAAASQYLSLEEDEKSGFQDLQELFHAGVTPYYASLLLSGDEKQTTPIRLQALPNSKELSDNLGQKDPLREVDHSPVKEVVHVYPDRVAFCVAMLCPVYCRYCYRKRRDEEDGLHYNRSIIARGLEYIRSQPAIKDVLITGGDPFIASDQAILSLVQKLREIPHVELIRFGTRTPVTLPYRVTKELATKLAEYHPIWVNTHFNCAEELTKEAQIACTNLINAGIPVGNQSVLLKGVNDSPERMKALCQALIRTRVRPYYVFHPHLVQGTEHLRVSIKRGLSIMKSLRGAISGYGIPSYILDTPSGKIPLSHQHLLGFDGDDALVEDLHGGIWREKGVLQE